MKHHTALSPSFLSITTRLTAAFLLMFSLSAHATAPRIAPKMFGEEQQVDVVGYQPEKSDNTAVTESKLVIDLLSEGFQAGGIKPVFDLLPSKQLAKYEFVINNAPALISSANDLTAKELKHYRKVTFFLADVTNGSEPVSLVFNQKNPRGDQLFRAFNQGMQQIIKDGSYLELLNKHLGKKKISHNFINLLKRHNANWK